MADLRIDRMDLPKAAVTPEGYLRGDAVVTRTGVFIYRTMDGTVRRELRHPDDVFNADSLASMRMVPIMDGHPSYRLVTAETAKDAIGMTGENVRNDDHLVVCPICITNADAVKRIAQQGGRELSLGYEVDLVMEPGNFNGEDYDARQTNIRYNHLAVVDQARAGHEARINLDGQDAILDQETHQRSDTMSELTKLARVALDGGLTYEAAPEVVLALNKARKDAEEAEEEFKEKMEAKDAEVEEAKEKAEKLKEENEDLKGKLDALSKRDIQAEIQAGIKSRVALLDSARKVLPASDHTKLDDMTDTEIKSAVVKAVFPKANLDGASADYLQARFDAAVESTPAKTSAGREIVEPSRKDSSGEGRLDAAEARKRMMEKNKNAWKKESK